MTEKLKVLAYFLPQFHRCSYNDKWWGPGFTEWSNVRAAKPLVPWQTQPRIPVDGEFDLTDLPVLEKQFMQARSSGIDGFAVYNYWYNKDRPLSKPLDIILMNKGLNFQFSLVWANHSWTRSWRNRRGSLDVLIKQVYGETYEKRREHYRYLVNVFSDHRYIKVENAPLFQIYIPEDIPNLAQYCDELREEVVRELGLKLHLSATIRMAMKDYNYLRSFDSATLAQPILGMAAGADIFGLNQTYELSASTKIINRLNNLPLWARSSLYFVQDHLPKKPRFYDYDAVWMRILEQAKSALNSSPIPINFTSFVDFDNTPRYKKSAKIFKNFSPERFESYLSSLAQYAAMTKNRLLFLNAWNEWGEGMHLQGDLMFPTQRLAAVKRALGR